MISNNTLANSMLPSSIGADVEYDKENDMTPSTAAPAAAVVEEQSFSSFSDFDDDDLNGISQGLESMNVWEQRKAATEEFHGVAAEVPEDDDFVDASIQELESNIESTPAVEKKAYLKALCTNPDYVRSRQRHLMFLRSVRFDTKEAAKKMLFHYEEKLKLFEEEVLGRDLVSDDLSPAELHMVECGLRLLLPLPDSAGRSIVFMRIDDDARRNIKLMFDGDIDSMTRTSWYFYQAVLKDENAQKRGAVIVVFSDTPNVDNLSENLKTHHQRRYAIPVRISGMHYCSESELGIQPPLESTRFRLHQGSKKEAEENLRSFGIPTQILPFLTDIKQSLVYHMDWIYRLRSEENKLKPKPLAVSSAEESSIGSDSGFLTPTRLDVLAGRGKSRDHPGNYRLRHIVETYQSQYEAANRQEKTHVAMKIVNLINESGGRFLRQDGGWIVMGESEAREKVSKLFRRNRTSQRRNN